MLSRYRKAQFALGKGDEDLAREALKRRKSFAVSVILYFFTLRIAGYNVNYFIYNLSVKHQFSSCSFLASIYSKVT